MELKNIVSDTLKALFKEMFHSSIENQKKKGGLYF